MSVQRNAAEDAEEPPLPRERGWRLVAELVAGDDEGLAVIPSSGACSLTHCLETTTAAVRRGPSRSRAGFWQAYCRKHARDRGVEPLDGRLEWVEDFGRRRDGPRYRP